MNVIIATEEHASEIERMCRNFKDASPYATFELSDTRLKEIVNAFLTGDKSTFIAFLAMNDENQPVGMVAAMATQPIFSDVKIAGELIWWVDVEYRQTRAGLELLNALETWAKQSGCSAITMTLLEDPNFDKIDGIYKKFGYRPSERSYLKEL